MLAPISAPLPRIAAALGVIAVLAALALVTRWGALVHEVIDWDESTFILVAADILRGGLPYGATLDNKPPLHPFVLAGALALGGESLATVRLLGAGALIVAASALAAMARPVAGAGPALLAGALVIAAASPMVFQPTLTEHLALAFLMPALWLLSGPSPGVARSIGAGVLVMAAVLCRSNLAVVALVLVVVVALPADRAGLRRASGFATGLAVPLGAIVALYLAAGQFDRMMLGMVRMPAAYAGGQTPAPLLLLVVLGGWINLAIAKPWVWVPFTLAGLIGLAARAPFRGQDLHADRVMLWAGLAVLASMALSGAFFRHHLLQLVPFAAWAALRGMAWAGPRLRVAAMVLAGAAVVAALAQTGPASVRLMVAGGASEHHALRRLAAAIAADRAPDDEVLALDGTLVAWYLDLPPPIPLALHPSNLVRPAIVTMLAQAGETGPSPLADLLDARPRYILLAEPLSWYLRAVPERALLESVLAEAYEPWMDEGAIRVWRRR